MERAIAACVGAFLCLAGGVTAQGFVEGLEAAQAKVAAKEWAAALEILIRLQDQAELDEDHDVLGSRLYDVGQGLLAVRAPADALRAFRASLAALHRILGDADDARVALVRNNAGLCLSGLGRLPEAIVEFEAAAAMQERLHAGDHPFLARALHNFASCLRDVGRFDEALAQGGRALEMWYRLDGATDDDLAGLHDLVARCLRALGRAPEAVPHCEEMLTIRRRIHGDVDNPAVATAAHELAFCLEMAGRVGEALAHNEAALAMRRRLFGDDHEAVATSLNNLGTCLGKVGRVGDALPRYEEALAIRVRLAGGGDSSDVASSLGNVAGCLTSLGRPADALPKFEAALAMRQRLYGDGAHHDLVQGEVGVGHCLMAMSRPADAMPYFERALAICRRLYGDAPHVDTAMALAHLAGCRHGLGRAAEGLAGYEQALAMRERLHGGNDHPEIVHLLGNVSSCLDSLGRHREALPFAERALAMAKRMFGDTPHPVLASAENGVGTSLVVNERPDDALPHLERALAIQQTVYGGDHPHVALALDNLGGCLVQLGQFEAALQRHEAAIAMRQRMFGGTDHRDVAHGLDRTANCLLALGRADEALPRFELALAMRRRLHADGDHPDVAMAWNDLGMGLRMLGRYEEASACIEKALAVVRRVHGGTDHPDVAAALANFAVSLQRLARDADALALHEEALAMVRRIHPDRDHTDVAMKSSDLGAWLQRHGRPAEALPLLESALAMSRRLSGDRPRGETVLFLDNVAACLQSLDRPNEAMPLFEQALAMTQRLHGDADHPDLAWSHGRLGSCLAVLGRTEEALAALEQSCGIAERVRDRIRLGAEARQVFFEMLKARGSFEQLQALAVRAGRIEQALHAAERSRGRELQDLLQQQRFDPVAEAEQRARVRGDDAAAAALATLREELASVEIDDARVLHAQARLDADDPETSSKREELLARAHELAQRRRSLLDTRARLCGDLLDVGRVRSPAEVQAALRRGELFLEFTITNGVALLYVVAREGPVQAFELPDAFATVQRVVPALLQRTSHAGLRGREPGDDGPTTASDDADRQLFASLIPRPLWERLVTSKRVFVAAHRELHRIPFELLATGTKDGVSTYWLDEGPPVSYVPSGSALCWLRERGRQASDDATALDLLAVGDPRSPEVEPPFPEHGAYVVEVNDGGEGARLGLQAGDVLTSYDGRPVADDKVLRALCTATEQVIEDGARESVPIPLEIWRRGNVVRLAARPGSLDVRVGEGAARSAREALLDSDTRVRLVTRVGDLERLGRLPPLDGARAETEAIEKVFADRKAKATRLVGTDAAEPAVFDLAAKAKYLHFACHGIAEEYAGQSLSMLVLSLPQRVLPGDDGFLKLGDLFHGWRGRLASCRLVVLSACRTNVGSTGRDEAPQALPIGFLFAGAPAVISSLWAVDDASTKELMTDFYSRLLAGETDKLGAFTAAKKALRAKYPDPFHWAPFLYIGAPD